MKYGPFTPADFPVHTVEHGMSDRQRLNQACEILGGLTFVVHRDRNWTYDQLHEEVWRLTDRLHLALLDGEMDA